MCNFIGKILTVFLLLLFSTCLEANYEVIIATSSTFTFDSRINEIPPLIETSNQFEFNTLTGISFTSNSDLFYFNSIGAQVGVDFIADTITNVGETVQFTDISTSILNPTSWLWDFGDGSPLSTEQNPQHVYYESGQKTVSLRVSNDAGAFGLKTKPNYLTINSIADGILLKIIKTKNDGPNITMVGYRYKIQDEFSNIEDVLVNNFELDDNGFAKIDYFKKQEDMQVGYTLISSFENEILLFDENDKQIGHIHYDYIPEQEMENIRNAILILHNDDEINYDDDYPYRRGTNIYDIEWDYYKLGEYPVSMLIPPNNTFSESYHKDPLLLLHGWEGKYKLITKPNAVAQNEETSYWFTTVKQLNDNYQFDTWQYYYPHNSIHEHIAIGLESTLDSLKQFYPNNKISLVTHSMGGLITLRYLSQFPDSAKINVKKVLFSAPPAHGSLGANLYHKTKFSDLLQIFVEYDNDAPSVKNMKLGSDETWYIYKSELPDLNNNGSIYDDYFVILGTTYKYYKSDTYFQRNGGFHTCLHPEASNHHDGIVSISSGSLLDKDIGFATFHGNHNDAVHMQSFIRGDNNNQNIGDEIFLPRIINKYFNNDYEGFISSISTEDFITTIVKHNKQVVKPIGQEIIENLDTYNGVDYHKGLINIEFDEKPLFKSYEVYYSSILNTMFLIPDLIPEFIDKQGFLNKGNFSRNKNSLGNKRYYFNEGYLLNKTNKNKNAITYNGCGINLDQGENRIVKFDINPNHIESIDFTFGYCQTNNVSFSDQNKGDELNSTLHNYTDSKSKNIILENPTPPDPLCVSFSVDNEVEIIEFLFSSYNSILYNFPLSLHLKLPDGTISDSTLSGSNYQYDQSLGKVKMSINDPMPGKWHLWLSTEHIGADTMSFNSVAFLKSDIYSYLPDSVSEIASSQIYAFKSGLRVNDFGLTNEIETIATIYKPDGEIESIDISSNVNTIDSSYIFTFDYSVNLPGEYLIKYNIEGNYDDYNFERCLHHYFEAIDSLPIFSVPDYSLYQGESQIELDLSEYTYNIDNYDTLYFSCEIESSNMDTTSIEILFDSLYLNSYIYSELSDTGYVNIQFNCHYNDTVISDTCLINVFVPELRIDSLQISDSIIYSADNLVMCYNLINSGNYHTGSYEVSYYLSKDSIIQLDDFCLGLKSILQHPPDSVISLIDTLYMPITDLVGDYNLLVAIDIKEEIAEIDETNNVLSENFLLNPAPDSPTIISVLPDGEDIVLTWTSNFQSDISGYIIHYGGDTTGVMSNYYTLNSDTVYTFSSLENDSTYYFAISAYRIMGVNSDRSVFDSVNFIYTPFALKVWLEGAYDGTFSMNTILNESNIIPNVQPYFSNPWSYQGLESVSVLPNQDIVDWILVELRETQGGPGTALPSTIVERKAGFLLNDGRLVELDGSSDLKFNSTINYNLYAVIYHRNHLTIMSSNPLIILDGIYSYDFTLNESQTYGGSESVKELLPGLWGMIAADGNADGSVNILDIENIWVPQAGESGYKTGDYNMDAEVDNLDKDDVWIPNENIESQIPE